MAKFYGAVGYGVTVDKGNGVWSQDVIERFYYGDVLRNTRKWEKGEQLNDNLNVKNSISIVADAYAYDHFFAIRYVSWLGQKWKVDSVEVDRPRLILEVGGVYNGPDAENGS